MHTQILKWPSTAFLSQSLIYEVSDRKFSMFQVAIACFSPSGGSQLQIHIELQCCVYVASHLPCGELRNRLSTCSGDVEGSGD